MEDKTGDTVDSADKKGEYNGSQDENTLPTYKTPSNVVEPDKPKQSYSTRILHSFRRREDHIHLNALGQQVIDPEKYPGVSEVVVSHDTSRLDRRLKGRHMQMIAIGGAIGTGLFIGSGSALATGGPLALIIGFGIVGIMLFCVIHALGELAVVFPIAGILLQKEIILIHFRVLLHLLHPIYRSCLGFCDGLELRNGLARGSSTRTDRCWHHRGLLELWNQRRRLHHHLPGPNRLYQFGRSSRIW